jgi:predicted glycoside hydrolase/deacetylase ChbG (UPF0249 family)
MANATIDLIINADDYGYYPCVSQGILEAAKSGALTATGILANSPNLVTQLQWLNGIEKLDVGVHLNLTCGLPLTDVMSEKLGQWKGQFPNAYVMSMLLMTGKMSLADIRTEWRAQIEVCQSQKLRFLNSHEHIHMLPVLFPLVLELAQDFGIDHVRLSQAEWLSPFGLSALIRNALIKTMQLINQRHIKINRPLFLGLSRSGKLDYEYLTMIFSKLKSGQSYELMCHPGHYNPAEISNARLLAYHDWEGELALLQSPKVHDLYEKFGIRLSQYSL